MSGSRVLRAIIVAVALCVPIRAQNPDILVLSGGRLLADPAAAPVAGNVVIRDGVITAAGAGVAAPEGARVFDVSGKVLVPAWIDAANGALFDPASWSAGVTGAGDYARDMLAACDPRNRWKLLRAGIGVVHAELPPRSGARGGTGAIAWTDPEPATPALVEPVAGVTFSLGGRVRNETTIALRKGSRSAITGALDGAKRYRETWEKFEKEKKEFATKLKEWEDKQKSGAKDAKKPADAPKEEPKREGEGGGRRRGLPPDFRDWPREKQREYLQEQMRRRGEGGGGEPEAKPADAPKDTSGKPKPPLPPEKNPANEALLRVLDRKVPLRVEAHWKEDIVAACEMARGRGVRLVLLGATEAREALEAIKAADAVVVLGPSLVFGADPLDRVGMRPGLAAALAKAGVPIAFMTAGGGGFRFDSLPLVAQLAIGEGLPPAEALRALTAGGAAAIGADDKLGSLAAGRSAAIQVLDGAPLEPDTRVHALVFGGKVVEAGGDRP